MKNLLKAALCTAVCAMALCVCAFAAETYTPDANGAYSVTYNGTAGEYYAILVVSGTYTETDTPAISEDSILYISQVTAGTDGSAAFTNFKPKTAVDGTVYIGGTDLDKAVLLGYLDDGAATGVDVSGTVTADSAWEADIALTSTADNTKVFTVTTTEGAYTLSVPLDTYKFTATMNAHLSYTMNALVVSEATTKNFTLVGGDTNADDAIDQLDLGDLLTGYNGTTKTLDVNGDGVVNQLDLGDLLANFSMTSVTE